jgi:hypothetical protein
MRFALFFCLAGMLWFGLVPSGLLHLAKDGAAVLGF